MTGKSGKSVGANDVLNQSKYQKKKKKKKKKKKNCYLKSW